MLKNCKIKIGGFYYNSVFISIIKGLIIFIVYYIR